MKSVGWIVYNTSTQSKGTKSVGHGWRKRNTSTRVYKSEKTAQQYCGEHEEPREVFILEPDRDLICSIIR